MAASYIQHTLDERRDTWQHYDIQHYDKSLKRPVEAVRCSAISQHNIDLEVGVNGYTKLLGRLELNIRRKNLSERKINSWQRY